MSTAITVVSNQSAAERQGLYLRVHTVNVYVRDQERSLRFYLDQLGFNLAFDVRLQSGQRCVAVSPPDGTAVLTLLAPEPESEEFKLIGQPTHVVFVTDDVAAKYAEWRKRGVRFRHSPRLRRVKYEQHPGEHPTLLGKSAPVWGGVFTCFEDLDRNTFELVSLDELTEAVEAQRQAATEKAESERRIAFELEIAREVQARLFPQTLPPMCTLDYAGICIQARQVGGDYYDFLNLGQGRLGLVLADISGKGIAAALLMANLQANLRSQCAIAVDEPQRLLKSVNELFYSSTTDSSYASLFFAEYDDQARRLRYANCGHLSALVLRRAGELECLHSTCTVIGLFKDWECPISKCQLSPGDALALYTDGITESFNAAGEEFGEHRLIEALSTHRELPAQDLLKAVINEVQQFSRQDQYDDITLIVAKSVSSMA
jgi:serine phosphatase RsbU (regulator of sigma subunit)/catechol 2,3-dioxygenase-like lactoylglutathione lyase family enzyme